MNHKFEFTFTKIEDQYIKALNEGYEFITCKNYYLKKYDSMKSIIVNRVDIDYSLKKADILREIFDRNEIKASFFIRLHANEYNPFSFENYNILKRLVNSGHEIGYHSEIIDQSKIWNESPEECLKKDINILNEMLNIKIKGIASHGGFTGFNNLSFWENNSPSEYGLFYEAYEETNSFNLFNNSFYISDSEFFQWKCYKHGKLVPNDRRSFGEHLLDKHKLIYLLIHPSTYYKEHPYEI